MKRARQSGSEEEAHLAKHKGRSQGRTPWIQVQQRQPAKKETLRKQAHLRHPAKQEASMKARHLKPQYMYKAPGQKKRSRQGGSEEETNLVQPNQQLLLKRQAFGAQEWIDPASSFRWISPLQA